MKKRFLVTMMGIAMTVSLLAGCGSDTTAATATAENEAKMLAGGGTVGDLMMLQTESQQPEALQASTHNVMSALQIGNAEEIRSDDLLTDEAAKTLLHMQGDVWTEVSQIAGVPRIMNSETGMTLIDENIVETSQEDNTNWDLSDSMEGLDIEFTKIYEVDANGDRGVEVIAASGQIQEADIVSGKTYEVELNIYNNSDSGVLRMVDINLEGISNEKGFFSISVDMARDITCLAHVDDDRFVQPVEQFFLKVEPNLVITPESVYTLIEKDAEGQRVWSEIGVCLNVTDADEVEFYHLRASVSVWETSAQTLIFRFAAA